MFNRKIEMMRAHPDSPYGKQWRHRALAVDKHGCLVFVIPPKKGKDYPPPLEVPSAEGEGFEEIFGRFL